MGLAGGFSPPLCVNTVSICSRVKLHLTCKIGKAQIAMIITHHHKLVKSEMVDALPLSGVCC